MENWSDDDSLWEALEPALCAPARVALAESDVGQLLNAVQIPRGSSVLDLGCGPGAHAVAMAARGYRVTGVDRTRRLLDRARQAAEARGVAVEWVHGDMRQFRRPGSFDLAVSLNTSFGYFDDAGNRLVLENVLRSLNSGGALLLDVTGRECTARQWQERLWAEVEGVLYLEHRQVVDDWSVLLSRWIVLEGGGRREFSVKQRLYAGTELRELLVSVGFGQVTLSGGLDGKTAYDHRATRLVALARLPGERT